ALVCDEAGRITHLTRDYQTLATRVVRLPDRALLPGLVNAHSHSFQRVIRGRTEHRANARDSFWTWREQMYAAALRLAPEDLYDAARMAFLEMALTGITAVGEFHYLHHAPDGTPYDDPNLLAKEVVRAARDVGLRIALLRVAYARAGFETPAEPQQARFIERDAQRFIKHTDELRRALTCDTSNENTNGNAEVSSDERANVLLRHAWVGVAPHSIRAVPLDYLREVCVYARALALPVHMHIAEQPAEVAACQREHGRTPILLLANEDLLDARFTAVHAVHVTLDEINALAQAHAHVCACPTTERNLGDGIVPANLFFAAGVPVALGTDSHVQIDLLEDARELEYHLRLQKLERAILAPERMTFDERPADQLSSLAARLFDCATVNGARSIGAPGGALAVGRAADFFTVDLNDPSIAGANETDLLPAIVFALARTAVREVVVGGRLVAQAGQHRMQPEIIERFTK
ncbi:MAG TPA: formimidoylglutamate deiminase, partial [Pyrinomonadaceae bacterium]|nr:formimidoylglutamate deiminase [Pyrinomonadaceae bacterium]